MDKQSSAVKNYSNIVFVHFFNKETMCYERGHCHFLICIFAGELIIKEADKEDIVVSAGQCVFVPRNHKLTFIKRPSKGVRSSSFRHFVRKNIAPRVKQAA